jgi:hypothetical protein
MESSERMPSFLPQEEAYVEILLQIHSEEMLQQQWARYYRSMDLWFAAEQSRCAVPTVADVAEHWEHWERVRPSSRCGP